MSDSDYLEPAKSIIERLGGVDVVAGVTGKHRTRVFRWMYSTERGGTGGLVPQREHAKLLEYATHKKIALSPVDFVQVPAEAAE